MDFDDLPRKKTGPLFDLEKEDISTLGVEELDDRIMRLKAEITRAETAKAARSASRSAAEALFGKK